MVWSSTPSNLLLNERLLLLLLLLIAVPAVADEFRPAYLQLTQTGPTTYDVPWKIPALDADAVM